LRNTDLQPLATHHVLCGICGADDPSPVGRGRDIFHGLPGHYEMVQCRHCTHVYMDPRPAPETLERLYPSTYYAYDRKAVGLAQRVLGRFFRARNASRLKQVVSRQGLARVPSPAILDIGCGDGLRLDYWREVFPNARTHGFEIVEAAVEVARRRGHDVQVGTIESAEFREAQFDIVFACDVIEHVADPLLFLKKARRWVRPGGLVLVTTPEFDCADRKLFGGRWACYSWQHWHLFTQQSMRRACEAVGLQIDTVNHYPRGTSWSWSMNATLQERGLVRAANALFPTAHDASIANVSMLSVGTAVDLALVRLTGTTSDAEYVLSPRT
jgi:2-polyprenyl-3-methyl-5-hydroxy-6-metoxy-1,4-benzoquinol methylase